LIGVTGWFTHGLVEFGLYIPALAWTGFSLAGLLYGASWPESVRHAPAQRLKTPTGNEKGAVS
jgi:hypothetical protein